MQQSYTQKKTQTKLLGPSIFHKSCSKPQANINNPVTYHFQAKSNNSTSTICINRQNQMTFNSPLTTYNPAKSVQSGHEQGQNMNNSALQKLTKPTSNH